MGAMMLKALGAAAAATALVTTPVQAACWNANETAAATVRELQSVLMVSALRCQVMKFDISGDYNTFLRANKSTIQQMNDRIKAHFFKGVGPVRGQVAYDAWTTSLANNHGAEKTNAETCDSMANLAREAALMEGSADGLVLLAARQGLTVAVPEGACELTSPTVALAQPGVTKTAAPATASATPSRGSRAR
jgi:hypothetical protein